MEIGFDLVAQNPFGEISLQINYTKCLKHILHVKVSFSKCRSFTLESPWSGRSIRGSDMAIHNLADSILSIPNTL